MNTNTTFRPGLYRHYKGGMYTAVMLVAHHETGCAMVLYTSHTTGRTSVRPLCGYNGDKDAWNDWIDRATGESIPEPAVFDIQKHTRRFSFIGGNPNPAQLP